MTKALRLAALSTALLSTSALALQISGVQVPDTVAVEGKTLKLNGAGIRKVYFIKAKVYVGALYLETASTDPAAIVSSDQTKAVHMYFLRDVGKEKIMNAFKEGFEKNSPDQAAALTPKLAAIGQAIADLKEGADLVVTYVPGKGTTVSLTGGGSATVTGKDFADAIFRNWLGSVPADEDLKAKMLAGGK
jgi:hypothetical protein